MCDKHRHKLISDIHSDRERELDVNFKSAFASEDFVKKEGFIAEGSAYADAIADDENVREKRAKLKDDKQSLLALGDALAYQMRYNEALVYYTRACELYPDDYESLRKRAGRLLSVLRVDEAEEAFNICLARTDDKLDIIYRLALCAYYRGDFSGAKEKFISCYELSGDNGEMYVAVLYWHIQCAVRLGEDVNGALKYYYDGLDFGHHIGYMRTVELFLKETKHCANADLNSKHNLNIGTSDSICNEAASGTDCEIAGEDDDELNIAIYKYGVYAYLLHKGCEYEARLALNDTLDHDTYFSSFAYLGAYSEKLRMREASAQKLKAFFKEHRRVALAFSGGADSALLLAVGKRTGADIKAYFLRSEFQPGFEIADAKRLAAEVGAECEFIDVSVVKEDSISRNDGDRCYFCKRRMFGVLTEYARRDGYETLIDGTNASDDERDRPGTRAIREFNVRSPLKECGITKSDVRKFSKDMGLFTWNKPSYSCLATRVERSERITEEILNKIECAESVLSARGFDNFRVRYSRGFAKIEIAREQNERFQRIKDEVFKELSEYFDGVKQSEILR